MEVLTLIIQGMTVHSDHSLGLAAGSEGICGLGPTLSVP